MNQVLDEARRTFDAADAAVTKLLPLLQGRLRKIRGDYSSVNTLRRLKSELRDFDSRTGCWK